MYVVIHDGIVIAQASTREGAELHIAVANAPGPCEIKGPFSLLVFKENVRWSDVTKHVEYGGASG